MLLYADHFMVLTSTLTSASSHYDDLNVTCCLMLWLMYLGLISSLTDNATLVSPVIYDVWGYWYPFFSPDPCLKFTFSPLEVRGYDISQLKCLTAPHFRYNLIPVEPSLWYWSQKQILDKLPFLCYSYTVHVYCYKRSIKEAFIPTIYRFVYKNHVGQ